MRYLLSLMAACLFSPAHAAEKITVTGEAIDTWCYFSGVMGGEDVVRGSAHHTCALLVRGGRHSRWAAGRGRHRLHGSEDRG